MASIGQRFIGTARDIVSDGRAVVPHPSGVVVFVAGLWLGESAEVRITAKQGRAMVGALVELKNPSPERIAPPCPHHGFSSANNEPARCGGCPWQFVRYEAQLAQKQQRVTQVFARLGAADKVKPIWASPQVYAYRNRAQLKADGVQLGFVAEGSQRIAPVDDCLVLSEPNRNTLRQLRQQLPNPAWKPSAKRPWVTLDIDEGVGAAEVSVNRRLPFAQGNSAQNARMRDWLAGQLIAHPSAKVLELFCGDGNFTEVIAAAGDCRVLAVEGDAEALARLESKQLAGVETLKADLFAADVFERIHCRSRDFDVLVLDPPRDGLKVTAGLLPKKSALQAVYYISCDLATLARDVAFFQQNGFSIQEIQPLDQFPHTPHIECLVTLKKR